MKQFFKLTMFVLLVSFFVNVKAQEKEKFTIGILPVTSTDGSKHEETVAITEAVTEAFLKTKRFVLVDRAKMAALNQEKNLQKTESYIDSETMIEQGKSLGAQYLITNSLTSYSNSGEVCKFTLSIQVIDVESGQIINSETVSSKGGGNTGIFGVLANTVGFDTNNPSARLAKALQSVSKQIDDFVNKNFPVVFSIIEIAEKGKKGATKVLITGGSDYGLSVGSKFIVNEVIEMNVGGKTTIRKKPIGNLQLLNLEGPDFSMCTVTSGGVDINEKFESNAKIEVESDFSSKK